MDKIQTEAMHIVTGAKQKTSHELLKKEILWDDLSVRRKLQQFTLIHKVIHNKFPIYLLNDLPSMTGSNTRLERQYKFNAMQLKHLYKNEFNFGKFYLIRFLIGYKRPFP